MALYTIKGLAPRERIYVAPAAICIATGAAYPKVCQMIRSHNGATAMRVSSATITAVLSWLGWSARPVKITHTAREQVMARLADREEQEKPSLAAWLKLRTPEERAAKLLVKLSNGGVVVVQGIKGGCSHSKGTVFLSDLNWRRAKVVAVWRLIDTEKAQRDAARAEQAALLAAITQRQQQREQNARRMVKPQAVLLAKRHAIHLVEQGGVIVSDDGAHRFESWEQARDRLREKQRERDAAKPQKLAVYGDETSLGCVR